MSLRILAASSLIAIFTSGCVPEQTAAYIAVQPNPPGIAPDGSVLVGEAAEIDEAFRTYRKAVLESDGKTAAALVTSDTQAYYRRMADAALKGKKYVLLSSPRTDCYTALLLRHELSKEQLLAMSGEEIVAFVIDRGHVSKRVTAKALIGNFEVDEDQAVGYLWYEQGKKYWNRKYYFERENGAWRFNVLPLMEGADTGFYLIKSREKLKSYEATYLYILEQATGRKPGPDIWNPPT